MGGKSKSQTVGYKYMAGMHHILCHGPIDNITRISSDKRLAWSGVATGGPIVVNAPEIYGGESREGGVGGTIDLEMGGPTQGVNTYLDSQLGDNVPAFRGVVGMVLRQFYFGNNPYIKPMSFRGTRIHVSGSAGAEQWYDEKAEIAGYIAPEDIEYIYVDAETDAGTTLAAALANGVPFTPTESVTLYPSKYNHITETNGNGVWSLGNGNFSGGFYYFTGGVGTAVVHDSGQYGTHAAAYAARTPLTLTGGVAYTFGILDAGGIGDNGQGVPFRIGGPPTGDMNGTHIVREALTDLDWGMGYSATDIDSVSFEACADQIFDEGLGMSLLWDKQIPIEDFISEVVKHMDAALYVSRTTGKFVLKLIRGDYDEGGLITLDESNIEKVANPSRPAPGELVNSVTVNYWNSTTGKNASLTVTDPALVQMQGQVINTTVQYPGFTNSRNATIAGQRDLRSLSAPYLTCTIYANEDASELNIGDVFKFSWANWQVSNLVMRVTGIAFGDGRKNQVRITCVQDVFRTPLVTVVNNTGGAWVNPISVPIAIPAAEQIAFEAPYYELVQGSGQTDVDSMLATNSEIGYVMTAAARPASAMNARVWLDDGSGYEDQGALDFCPSATLTTDITKTQTSFTIDDMDEVESIVLGSHFQVGEEIMRLDTLDTLTGAVTVGRGVLDTVPQEHLAGDFLLFWDLFNGYSVTEYVMGETLDAKLTPITGGGQLDIADATAVSVTMAQRAFLPYAPGDLQVNGDSYLNLTYSGELTITYAHRNRLQQTSGVLADHTAGDIGPEAGTEYRLQGYVDGVLTHTEDDNATTTFLWTPADEGYITAEVHAKRDGVYSFQAPSHTFLYLVGGEVRAIETGDVRFTEEGDVRVTED